MAKRILLKSFLIVAAGLIASTSTWAQYAQTNLVSDIPNFAAFTDPNLKNPWGIASSATSPFWVADNLTGLSTLYNSSGTPQALVVTIPPPPGSPAGTLSTPTGTVFNASSTFLGDRFLFATQGGTIAGWQGGTAAAIRVTTVGAIYTGLTIGTAGSGDRLYAADFFDNRIDVFDSGYNPLSLGASAFTDPNLPAGYAPFNIQSMGGRLYVTYTESNAGDEVPGAGHGFIDTFTSDGALIGRLVSGGALDAPWGMAIAPAGFGEFANTLLVGNFGDGTINAFDPLTGALLGTLLDALSQPIVNDGLWGLRFGNGGNGGNLHTLYIAAGINQEQDGLFAAIAPVPEPATLALLGIGLAGLGFARRRRLN